MSNLMKAIDLKCRPIMRIHYVFHSRQYNFYFFRLLHKWYFCYSILKQKKLLLNFTEDNRPFTSTKPLDLCQK